MEEGRSVIQKLRLFFTKMFTHRKHEVEKSVVFYLDITEKFEIWRSKVAELDSRIKPYANWIVVSPEWATIYQMSEHHDPREIIDLFVISKSVHYIGKIGRIKVYKNLLFSQDKNMMGYDENIEE